MDPIKESFRKVKDDINFLKTEIEEIKTEIKKILSSINPTQKPLNPTNPTDNSTHNSSFKALKQENSSISTGNQGVPTNRQTDKQTNRHTIISYGKPSSSDSMENALRILNSLDSIKKELRLKFKNLTEQEFLVFSTIYQLDEESGYSDYRTISKMINLSESSVRDYVGRIIKKGISVEKRKIYNKNIQLTISQNLKKVVSLNTIMQLRDL